MSDISIVETHPELLKEWDFDQNSKLGYFPENVSKGSHIFKVWWKCNLGHNWEAFVSTRVKGNKCPYCSNKKVWTGFNDIESKYPEIAKEWDYDKNNITPNKVLYGTVKKYYWKCSLGHSYPASPKHRTQNGSGCPVCKGKKIVSGFNDFASAFPELVGQWNYEKNDKLLPAHFAKYSNKEVWWKCDKGHEWPMEIALRTRRKYGCPICSGNRVLIGYNDLATQYPQIASEWNKEKNDIILPTDFTGKSGKEVWWKCDKGHEWKAKINNRTLKNSGCPNCFSSSQTSFSEQAVFYYLKRDVKYEVLNRFKVEIDGKGVEIDIFIPELKIGVEYDGIYWHKNKVDSDSIKNKKINSIGIQLFRIKEGAKNEVNGNIIFFDSQKDLFTNLSWSIKQVEMFLGITDKVIDIDEDYTFILEQCNYTSLNNSLASKSPDIAKEWNYKRNNSLEPIQFSNGSNKKVWWICGLGHEWQEYIVTRTYQKTGCPFCSGHRVLEGFNDLKTKCPDLVREWNYIKNVNINPSDYTVGSHDKVWWICEKGHEWCAAIKNRVNGSGCPDCNKKLVKVSFENCSSKIFENCSLCAEEYGCSKSLIIEYARKNAAVGKQSSLYKMYRIVKIEYILK